MTQQLVDAGAIDVLLTVMDLAPQSAGLQEAATYALCNICATPGYLKFFVLFLLFISISIDICKLGLRLIVTMVTELSLPNVQLFLKT